MTVYASLESDSPGHTPVFAFESREAAARARNLVLAGAPPAEAAGAVGGAELDPRTDLANHSPSGLSWGYRGSGAAQTALAILAHETDPGQAVRCYQELKDRVVARAPQDERLVVVSGDIDEVLGAEP